VARGEDRFAPGIGVTGRWGAVISWLGGGSAPHKTGLPEPTGNLGIARHPDCPFGRKPISYVRQGELFSYEDFVGDHDDNERLVLTLSALPDEGLVSWLRGQRKGRRDDYPLEMLWRCVIAKYVYQIRTYAELIRERGQGGASATHRALSGVAATRASPEPATGKPIQGRSVPAGGRTGQ
jgi:hypothetical protein